MGLVNRGERAHRETRGPAGPLWGGHRGPADTTTRLPQQETPPDALPSRSPQDPTDSSAVCPSAEGHVVVKIPKHDHNNALFVPLFALTTN